MASGCRVSGPTASGAPANAELTAELALALGHAAARVLPAPTFVVGRDTRRSGPLLQAALSAGLAAEGADVVDVGVLPTPGVAYCAEQRAVPGGRGLGLPQPLRRQRHQALRPRRHEAGRRGRSGGRGGDRRGPRGRRRARPDRPGVGTVAPDAGAAAAYRRHLAGALDGRRLDGLRVVLDCANGAAARWRAGVFEPSGPRSRRRVCSPTAPTSTTAAGRPTPTRWPPRCWQPERGLGLAFDGDADRVVAVDHTGAVVHGDRLMALFAVDLAGPGRADRATPSSSPS